MEKELGPKKKVPRIPGESFRRVDTEVWSQHVINGLDDNSCMWIDIIHILCFHYLLLYNIFFRRKAVLL